MKSLIPVRDISTFKPYRIDIQIDDRGIISFGGAKNLEDHEDDAKLIYTETNFAEFMRSVMNEEVIWKRALNNPIAGRFSIHVTNNKYVADLSSMDRGANWEFIAMVYGDDGDVCRSVGYDTLSNRVELESNFQMDEVTESYNVSIPYLAKYSNLIRNSIVYQDYKSLNFRGYDRIGFVIGKMNVVVVDEPYCAANGIEAIDIATKILKSVPENTYALIVVQNYAPPVIPKKKTTKKTTTTKKPAAKKETTTKKTPAKKPAEKKTTAAAKKSTTTKTAAAKKTTTTKKPSTKKTTKKEENDGKA